MSQEGQASLITDAGSPHEMRFRLIYEGELKSNGDAKRKALIRNVFEPQLRSAWRERPLSAIADYTNPDPKVNRNFYLGVERGGVAFIPLVSEKLGLRAELDVLLLTNSPPGQILKAGGDIDNRMKTLFDALTIPDANQFHDAHRVEPDNRYYCLMQDDKLVTRVTVETDRSHRIESSNDRTVLSIITVHIFATIGTMANLTIAV